MRVGYYFHVGAVVADGVASIPAHYGVFLSEIARQSGSVLHYGHRTANDGTQTWALEPPELGFVDLGPKGPNPVMALVAGRFLRRFRPSADGLDVMLVRGPTALLPSIVHRCRRAGVPVAVLLVADYRNWRPMAAYPWWRNQLIRAWLRIYRYMQRRSLGHAEVFAISETILRGDVPLGGTLARTSAFTERELAMTDSWERRPFPTKGERPVRLLLTGRLVEEKGLFELIHALAELVERGHDLTLTLVGYTSGDPTVDQVIARAQELGVGERLEVEGFRPAGEELLREYFNADIYVLPTYGEGSVPRTVKEAFACRLPVITTTVKAISELIEDGREALLIPPRSAEAVTKAVERLIADEGLRDKLVASARLWVAGYTNEASAGQIVGELRRLVARSGGPRSPGSESRGR